jgi:hypothetical protein
MARGAYSYVLLHDKYGRFGKYAKQFATADLIFLDLEDEVDMVETMVDLITRHGGHGYQIEQYLLAIRDKTTGDVLERITPSRRDLQAVRDGLRTPKPESIPRSLEEASDELLVSELLRRLKNR